MNCSRWGSLAASIFARQTLELIVAMKLPVVVAFDTPAGQAAWTTEPSRVMTSTAVCRPAGGPGIALHRKGQAPAILGPPPAGQVEVTHARARAAGLLSLT